MISLPVLTALGWPWSRLSGWALRAGRGARQGFLIAFPVCAWTILPAAETTEPSVYFEQEIAASNGRRLAQAEELRDYIRQLRASSTMLEQVFQPDSSSPSAFAGSLDRYREAFALSLGFPASGEVPQEPARFERMGEDELGTYYRAYIPVRPGLNAEGIYIVPKGTAGRLPLVIARHGGAGSPELALFNGGSNYHGMVRGAVKRGYVAFAPQLLFSSPGLATENCRETDRRFRQSGTSLVAVEIGKIIRSIDVLTSRPEIDPDRTAMIGLSYSGFYTLVTTALEPRIKVAVCSGYFGIQEGRYARDDLSIASDLGFPARFTVFRDPELVALICPRPLQIQAGRSDDPLHQEAGEKLAPVAAGYYDRLGQRDRFEHRLFDGGHEFNDALAWAFLQQHL